MAIALAVPLFRPGNEIRLERICSTPRSRAIEDRPRQLRRWKTGLVWPVCTEQKRDEPGREEGSSVPNLAPQRDTEAVLSGLPPEIWIERLPIPAPTSIAALRRLQDIPPRRLLRKGY